VPEENTSETVSEQPSESKNPTDQQNTRPSFIPVILSGLALLLAAFALTIALISNRHMAASRPMTHVKDQLASMETRINHMEAMMLTDKHSHVQTELRKMLFSLHELSGLGDSATKLEISKVEAILQRLSTPATRIKAKVDLKSTEQPAQPQAPTLTPPASEPIKQHPQAVPTSPASEQKSQATDASVKTGKQPANKVTAVPPVSLKPVKQEANRRLTTEKAKRKEKSQTGSP